MERVISRKMHGIAELLFIPVTALSPELSRFSKNSRASIFARTLGGIMLSSALLTRAEWGLFKKVPFRTHLAADAGLSLLAILAPWIGNFSHNKAATFSFLFVGISGLIVSGLLTERREMKQSALDPATPSSLDRAYQAAEADMNRRVAAQHEAEEEDSEIEDTY
ncbi:MAG TPA: hypothetical protein VGE26_05590 [Sphingobacteriaceae bacterium]